MTSKRVFPTTTNLPDGHLKLIGSIAVHHAALEGRIKSTIHEVLKIGPKRGRLALKDQRIGEQLTLLEQLLNLACIEVPPEFDAVRNDLKAADDCRNALLHGLWIEHPDISIPVLQVTKGEWRMDRRNKPERPRKIDPEGIPISESDLLAELNLLIVTGNQLGDALRRIDNTLQTSP